MPRDQRSAAWGVLGAFALLATLAKTLLLPLLEQVSEQEAHPAVWGWGMPRRGRAAEPALWPGKNAAAAGRQAPSARPRPAGRIGKSPAPPRLDPSPWLERAAASQARSALPRGELSGAPRAFIRNGPDGKARTLAPPRESGFDAAKPAPRAAGPDPRIAAPGPSASGLASPPRTWVRPSAAPERIRPSLRLPAPPAPRRGTGPIRLSARPRPLGDGGGAKAGITRSAAPRERPAPAKLPRFKPPTLKDWLGLGSLRPPQGKLEAPSFASLKNRAPARLPDGRPVAAHTPMPAQIEVLAPPQEEALEEWLEKDARRGREGPHWHHDLKNRPYYHSGKAWGTPAAEGWAWMMESRKRWWTLADGAQRLARHGEQWWWRNRDGWYLLHQGQPWAWRHFGDWAREGLIHPSTGTRIFYSADGARAAVLTPGKGAAVFDARTGRHLIDIPEVPGNPLRSEDLDQAGD